MAFDPLPGVSLSWDESAVALDDWLRYSVYRRVSGATTWTRIANIHSRSETSYTDFAAPGNVLLEFATTQTIDAGGGSEVESAFPTPVQVTVPIVSYFIHAFDSPGNYVQIAANQAAVQNMPEVTYRRAFSARLPVGHVGPGLARSLTVGQTGIWDEPESRFSRDTQTAIRALLELQAAGVHVFVVRGGRDVSWFAQVDGLNRSDAPILFQGQVRLTEVEFDEAVS